MSASSKNLNELRIERLDLGELQLTNRRPFRVSTHFTDSYRAILCRLTINGSYGYGAGGHCRLTGETAESVSEALQSFSKKINGQKYESPEVLRNFIQLDLKKNPSAAAALDMAVWDSEARQENVPLWQLLAKKYKTHPSHTELETDMTIGLETAADTIALACEHIAAGFKKLKIKMGHPLQQQIELTQLLRKEVGQSIELTADANQGYSVEEAIQLSHVLKDLDFLIFEQPVVKEDLKGLGKVTKKSPLPVFADEGARTEEQINEIGKNRFASGIVLKLYKYGGITPALHVIELARKYNLEMMIGCYADVSLSIAAAMHLALAFPEINHIDLDSHLLAEKDPLEVITTQKNRLTPRDIGLGFCEKVEKFF